MPEATSPSSPLARSPSTPTSGRALRAQLRRAETELAVAEATYQAGLLRQLHQAESRFLSESNLVTPERDDPGWGPLAGDAGRNVPELRDAATVRNQSYRLWRLQPHARGILRNMVRFIVGREFGVDFADTARGEWSDKKRAALKPTEDEDAPTMVGEVCKDFVTRNRFKSRTKETVIRAFRDGDAFVRGFVKAGKVTVRFIEPEHVVGGGVADPGRVGSAPAAGGGVRKGDLDGDEHVGEATAVLAGVEFLAADVETVVAYHVRGPGDDAKVERVPACQVVHFKPYADSSDVRGIPMLEVVARRLANYDQWEEYRMILNKVRTSVGLVRTVEGTSAQAAAIVANRASPRPDPRGQEPQTGSGRREAMFKPGTVLTPSAGVKYEYLSPKLEASDASEDGRRFLLAIAAGVGQPEMLVTGDWSNANFASTVEARTPAVREWEDWQEFFEEGFSRIIEWALRAAMGELEWVGADGKKIDGGSLGLPEDTDAEATIQWTAIVTKDAGKETERNAVLNAAHLLSEQTWAAREDLNYEDEQDNFREAAEAKAELMDDLGPEHPGLPGLGIVPPPPPAGAPGAPGAPPGRPIGQSRVTGRPGVPAPRQAAPVPKRRPAVASEAMLRETGDVVGFVEGAAAEADDPEVAAALRGYLARVRPLLVEAGWDESDHPRHPAGSEDGGQFSPASGGVGPVGTPRDWSPERAAVHDALTTRGWTRRGRQPFYERGDHTVVVSADGAWRHAGPGMRAENEWDRGAAPAAVEDRPTVARGGNSASLVAHLGRVMHEWDEDEHLFEHYGPGDHPGTGTPQSVHGGEEGGEERPVNPDFQGNPNDPDAIRAYIAETDRDPAVAEAKRKIAETPPTTARYSPDGEGHTWTPERAAIHEQILMEPFVDDKGRTLSPLFNPAAEAPDGVQPIAILRIGLPGSGKSTALRDHTPAGQYTTVNPDDAKERLPEWAGWNASVVHEESSHITDTLLLERAVGARHNLIIDKTGKSLAPYLAYIEQLGQLGYQVHVQYVEVPIGTALERAYKRFKAAGRYVPLEYIFEKMDSNPGRTYERVKALPGVASVIKVDNSGATGVVVDRRRGENPR